ncbi:MAG: replication-associated recombination protein A [Clostridia bacterium]|nr:replication-associated recombination protein A [Clostridia bacterium]
MDLFDLMEEKKNIPLAERMRPSTLKEFIGQEHIVSPTSLLSRAIKMDNLGSCIFWGPPGTGKSTLANVIANSTGSAFFKLNAVSSGVGDVKKVIEEGVNNRKLYGKRTYLFLDECHRFNKAQCDSLLSAVESGDVIFIGSTTENPYASMTPAIVSRCRIFELKRLSTKNILEALYKAISSKNGFGDYNIEIGEDALKHIANLSAGDLRVAYNALEMAVLTTTPDENGVIKITLKDAEESIQRKALSFDETLYYDILSAFCKSLRGSDSDAALYYMQRLVEGGLDPLIIARRVVAHASEDIGMADPNAMVQATSALLAYERLGLPEGLLPISQAIVYVCEAEKSNAVYLAMHSAKEDALKIRDDTVPPHLKNTGYKSEESKALSKNYKYPHDFGGYIPQQYLPDELKGRVYYNPTDNGYEKVVKEIRKKKGK